MVEDNILQTYEFYAAKIPVKIEIKRKEEDFVPLYEVIIPTLSLGTRVALESAKAELLSSVHIELTELLDPKKEKDVKKRFETAARKILSALLTGEKEDLEILVSYLVHDTFGLGKLEILLHDEQLEEIAINNSKEPVWVYHKKFGWCKTNLYVDDEQKIYDKASLIARRVGRSINVLNPILDAHLPSGERVNATLFPISNFGNTITIRKFSKNPWTMIRMISTHTISSELAAFLWLGIQDELSFLIAGGTGSGKTSFLNALAGLIPPNQRIISIEDTRELTLPSFLHWVPLVTREPNPEGKGEITMLDLLVNSLRMRPDRIIVGEVRRQREAEILFEAMHTGHSVYATLHADNAEQAVSRLTTPPINLPEEILDALPGIVVQYRHRRMNIRRTLEFAEITSEHKARVVYRWDIRKDSLEKLGDFTKLMDTLELYTGMTPKEIWDEVEQKKTILEWMADKNYTDVDEMGRVIAEYYRDPDTVYEMAKKGDDFGYQ